VVSERDSGADESGAKAVNEKERGEERKREKEGMHAGRTNHVTNGHILSGHLLNAVGAFRVCYPLTANYAFSKGLSVIVVARDAAMSTF